jgi:hypothetical protein
MEKEKYIAPEVEIVEFDTEDVITTSNTRSSSSNEPIELPLVPL